MRGVFAAAVIAAACTISPHDQSDFVVAYRVTASTGITCDSVKYENAVGAIVTVASPTLPWAFANSAPPGSAVQARAWMTATASGQQAKLKATWTLTGVSTAGDSSYGTTTAGGQFSLVIVRRRL
jgi:hypothetical protein